LLDISTNGAAESAELLKRAKMMREQADIEEMDGTSPIDYAEMVFDDFGLREHIINENLRDG
jgi:hypothetical protein